MYDQGKETKEIATQLLVSPSWCRRVKQRRGQPRPRIGGGHFKLDAAARSSLEKFVAERPDATLEELRKRILKELNITVSIGALWDTLRRLKLTLKKSR